MDPKTVNFIFMIVGVILALTGGQTLNLIGYMTYISTIIGIVLIIVALYGLKQGRVFY